MTFTLKTVEAMGIFAEVFRCFDGNDNIDELSSPYLLIICQIVHAETDHLPTNTKEPFCPLLKTGHRYQNSESRSFVDFSCSDNEWINHRLCTWKWINQKNSHKIRTHRKLSGPLEPSHERSYEWIGLA